MFRVKDKGVLLKKNLGHLPTDGASASWQNGLDSRQLDLVSEEWQVLDLGRIK